MKSQVSRMMSNGGVEGWIVSEQRTSKIIL